MSDKNDDFLSFEKALRELKLRSEELRKLVSEGEIRARKDGDSMKFKKEDVAALAESLSGKAGTTAPIGGDALEDDTGMVTEQISDEDTLLADDEPAPTPAKAQRAAAPARAARPVAVGAGAGAGAKEPGWVIAFAVLGFFATIWATMVHYSISQESDPKSNMFTSAWSDK